MTESLIELKNIQKVYKTGEGEVFALRDINVSISRGEFVAIVGRSGSGKSTLMNILGCLDAASGGEYLLQGVGVDSLSERQLSELRCQSMGFIFQSFNLIPSLTALENVELPLLYRGITPRLRKTMAARALNEVGLQDRMHHLPNELSGGQQQRVAIARSVAVSPAIILADEPTGNLDISSGTAVMDILLSLNRRGHTIILITHDPALAESAPRTLLISDGRLIKDSRKTIAADE